MGSEDDTVIMPRDDEPPGEPPGDGPENGPEGLDKRSERYVVIGMVIAVIIVAGLLVLLIRACGGDEPAPQSRTVTQTVTDTRTVTPTTATQARTQEAERDRLDLRSVNWKSEVGAQPMVREVEDVIYADLDGDGQEDALVLVRHEGSGGYLDYYVYKADGTALRLLFEKTGVDQGRVELASIPRSFVETSAVYAPEDPVCCPSRLQLITYTWSSSAGSFVESDVKVVPNPDL
ncbi:MAG: hypothetical protein C4534_00995 [Gaiellales bacterium]|nr:MAG: hypothetical protein C4534_00995 [Gaiellales bacterium]